MRADIFRWQRSQSPAAVLARPLLVHRHSIDLALGVSVLAMALVLMGGWVRGLSHQDSVEIPIGRSRFSVLSSGPSIFMTREYYKDAAKGNLVPDWKTASLSAPSLLREAFHKNSIFWRWRWFGFGFFDCSFDDLGYRLSLLAIPYSSVAVSLTLLAALLLLSKPRKATSKRIAESRPASGS